MAHSKLYVRLMNSREWRQLRWQVIAEHPLCERCEAKGYITASRCVHHLIPVESGKTEAECRDLAFRRSNLQALCYQCHSEIHKAERSHSKEVMKERNEERLSVWAYNIKRKYGNGDGANGETAASTDC